MSSDIFSKLPPYHYRTFLPSDLVVQTFDDVFPYLIRLQDYRIENIQDLENWLDNYSEVSAAIKQVQVCHKINALSDTSDPQFREAWNDCSQHFIPRVESMTIRLYHLYRDVSRSDDNDNNRKKLWFSLI